MLWWRACLTGLGTTGMGYSGCRQHSSRKMAACSRAQPGKRKQDNHASSFCYGRTCVSPCTIREPVPSTKSPCQLLDFTEVA